MVFVGDNYGNFRVGERLFVDYHAPSDMSM